MKKHTYKTLVSVALLLCLLSGITAVTAFADFAGTYSVGQDIQNVLVYSSNDTLSSVSMASGSLPAGVNLGWTSDGVYLYGNASNTGTFTSTYVVSKGNTTESFNLTIKITEGVTESETLATVAPAATPNPASGTPTITKHPTGETVDIGGTAKFVAKAENYNNIVWRLVSEDTTVTYPAADAPAYFGGLRVDGIGTEKLTLSNIPAALDGWCVEAKFIGTSGTVYSYGARIRVNGAYVPEEEPNFWSDDEPENVEATPEPTVDTEMKTATIVAQPYGANKTMGEEYTVSLMATSPNNGDLSYQWYVSDTESSIGGTQISGANSNSYTVPQTEGRKYYYCAIWNTREGRVSEAKYSDIACVYYAPVATPTPEPTAAPSPTPSRSGGTSALNTQLILFSALGVIALLSLIGVLVYLRIASEREEKPVKSAKSAKRRVEPEEEFEEEFEEDLPKPKKKKKQ